MERCLSAIEADSCLRFVEYTKEKLSARRTGEWDLKLFNWIRQQKHCLPLLKLKKIWEAELGERRVAREAEGER